MVNVTLVCVAGVSGTFLARRMRALDPTLTIAVANVDSFESTAADSDCVLIAPQLAASLDTIASMAVGVPLAVLPAESYSPSGAAGAVRTVHDLTDAAEPAYRRSITVPTKE